MRRINPLQLFSSKPGCSSQDVKTSLRIYWTPIASLCHIKTLLKTSAYCLPPPRDEGDKVRWFFTKKDRVYFIDNRPWKDSFFASDRRLDYTYYEEVSSSLLKYCFKHLNRDIPPYNCLCLIHDFQEKACAQIEKGEVDKLYKSMVGLIHVYMGEVKRKGVITNWGAVLCAFYVFFCLISFPFCEIIGG